MSEATGKNFQGDAYRKGGRWWHTSPPIEWWKRHPWIVWWVNLLLLPQLVPYLFDISDLLSRILGLDDPSRGGVVIPIFLMIFLVVFCSSFIQGLRVSWRKEISRMRVMRVLILWIIIGILLAIEVPLFLNIDTRSRLAKAQVDVQTLAHGVTEYSAHMGSLPGTLTDLMLTATNSEGETGGPYLDAIPTPPHGWTEYRYEVRPDGTFSITSSGDRETVTAPEAERGTQ